MTTGRPPIRPNPDHEPPVVSGLGADERRVDEPQDDGKLLRSMCNGQDAIFGMEDGAGEELKASDEGEQAARIAPLPTPFQPTLSQFRTTVSRITRTGQGARIAWRAEAASSATAES